MKSSSAHRSSFIHRWFSKTSNATTNHDDSETTNPFSPPPLTDSSSTAPSSTILTPRTTSGTFAPPVKSHRVASGIQPCTPPTRYASLPVVTSSQAVSSSYKHQPAPSAVVPTEIKLHRFLSHEPMRRTLKFDISLPPMFILKYPQSTPSSTVVVRTQLPRPRPSVSLQPMTNDDLSPLATIPPVTRMRIITDLLPWSITVRGRSVMPNDPESFVRIVDVLDGIYKSLREGVSSDEWNRMPKSFRDQVKKAYARRCQASLPFSLQGYEERQGIRRVDYLKDKTMFSGLAINAPDTGNVDSFKSVTERTWIIKLAPRHS